MQARRRSLRAPNLIVALNQLLPPLVVQELRKRPPLRQVQQQNSCLCTLHSLLLQLSGSCGLMTSCSAASQSTVPTAEPGCSLLQLCQWEVRRRLPAT